MFHRARADGVRSRRAARAPVRRRLARRTAGSRRTIPRTRDRSHDAHRRRARRACAGAQSRGVRAHARDAQPGDRAARHLPTGLADVHRLGDDTDLGLGAGAHFVPVEENWHDTDNFAKHARMFGERLEKGQTFHHPYLGCREFAAAVEPGFFRPRPPRLPRRRLGLVGSVGSEAAASAAGSVSSGSGLASSSSGERWSSEDFFFRIRNQGK